jgi:hypothetical protein
MSFINKKNLIEAIEKVAYMADLQRKKGIIQRFANQFGGMYEKLDGEIKVSMIQSWNKIASVMTGGGDSAKLVNMASQFGLQNPLDSLKSAEDIGKVLGIKI